MGQTFQRIIESLLFSVALTALFSLGCTTQQTPSYSGPPTKMVIGATRDESSAILFTAHQLNFFKLLPSGNGGIRCEQ